ncbi:MAG: two-component system sensor kinase FixL [Planctomycetota bacterium]
MNQPGISGKDPQHYDRLETLLKNLPGMAYRCLNLNHWPMDFVSDGCFNLCGYERHEIESQSVLWGDFTHPDMIDEVDQKVRKAAERGEPFEVEYRIITRNGTEKWVWERGRVVEFRDDGVAILEGFITDITDRKQAETALRQAEIFSQAVVDSAVEAIITIDHQARIESFNQTASEIFGYAADEVRNQHCRVLLSTAYYREFDQYFDRQGHNQSTDKGIEFNAVNQSGDEFPIHFSLSQIYDKQSIKFVVLIRDLTHQRAAEKEAREQRDVLAHVDRLNTLGEMAAGIAHEINQPLTAISMYAESSLRFLDKEEPRIDRVKTALEKLVQQAHRAGAVIERMQEMTRPRDSRHEVTDCLRLIHQIHELAEVEAQLRYFIIVLRLEQKMPAVRCDPIQIQQVILNLLRNGMESMKTHNCKSGSKIILKAQASSSGVQISINDSGMGISRALEKQLYQPFTTTKESGMGLGLTISRSIIEAHGGQLSFRNNKTAGATFFFDLPGVG